MNAVNENLNPENAEKHSPKIPMLEHAPELPDDHEVDYKPTDGFELVSVTKDFGSFGVKKKGLDFVAFVLGMDESDPSATATSPLSIEAALNALAAKQGLIGDFKFEETTTTHDELAQERIFKVSVTFNTENAPEGDDVETQEPDSSVVIYFDCIRTLGMVGEKMTTFKTKKGALQSLSSQKFGLKPCFFENQGREFIGNTMWDKYVARPAFELTEDHPRIKVKEAGDCSARATCNGISSTSTGGAKGAIHNLLKKMNLPGSLVEITTLDDIEAEVQMFTVI